MCGCGSVDSHERERGHAVLSIKMPALCFHTVEQQAGPIAEDMASNCRPDQRSGAARINKDRCILRVLRVAVGPVQLW